jgi:hypothetical protein
MRTENWKADVSSSDEDDRVYLYVQKVENCSRGSFCMEVSK